MNKKTKYDAIITKLKNQKWFVIILFIFGGIVGFGTFVKSIKLIKDDFLVNEAIEEEKDNSTKIQSINEVHKKDKPSAKNENNTKLYKEVLIFLNSDMSNSTIKINNESAIVLDDKVIFKRIKIPINDKDNYIIEAKNGKKTCKKSINQIIQNQKIYLCDI